MAAKAVKSVFFCQECGYESAKWMGQCPGCHAWNTMVEEPVRAASGGGKTARSGGASVAHRTGARALSLREIAVDEKQRFDTGIGEFNRVLGSGLVRGALTLIGGDPGIGKSTLLLQVARHMSAAGLKILYVSGEESLSQIKLRAARIGEFAEELKFFCETDLDTIIGVVEAEKPAVLIIDSIQTMASAEVSAAPGSVSQVRETTGVLLKIAKSEGISVFIVGHVTKEGTVAGPRVLEHMVDTVLYFEGDRHASYRILRAVKNRFGSTNEIGVFEMGETGLTEVENPSQFMLEGRPLDAGGSIVTCAVEGTRPILMEVQALVTRTSFGFPRRQAAGADLNRVNLLMAVLEKRVGLALADCDAYVNLAGGVRLQEPALDLGICLAVVTSFRNFAADAGLVAFGEVGLSGEVRAVSLAEQRVAEAARLGFTDCILPAAQAERIKKADGVKLHGVRSLNDALRVLGIR
ncbi:MAG: DNA repair protein RadA [Lachnospiraceae bacterium]|nr:DNA repair protein RadA [Lachnospiraceae bacterium]